MGWLRLSLTAKKGRGLYYAIAGIIQLASLWHCYQDTRLLDSFSELRAVDVAAMTAVALEAVVCLLGWIKNCVYVPQGGLLCY
jgi:hypothetical protein